jgi:phosphatidylinositol kinase/protein kinase (PI-3  family)
MAFYQEPTHYEKTILSDLQGSWELLREAVINEHKTKNCSQLLFHIDEAMSWESVRNLEQMKNTFVLIQSIAQQLAVSDETTELIEDVRSVLYEVLDDIQKGAVL